MSRKGMEWLPSHHLYPQTHKGHYRCKGRQRKNGRDPECLKIREQQRFQIESQTISTLLDHSKYELPKGQLFTNKRPSEKAQASPLPYSLLFAVSSTHAIPALPRPKLISEAIHKLRSHNRLLFRSQDEATLSCSIK